MIAHPPVLWLVLALAGWGFDGLTGLALGLSESTQSAGRFAVGLGFALILWCALVFRRAGTNVPTHRPALRVVCHGPYRVSRNPIYLGFMIAFVGLAAALDSPGIMGLAPILALSLHHGVILREEAYLAAKFGDEYEAYRSTVRRWL